MKRLLAIFLIAVTPLARGALQYSGVQNLSIPLTLDGRYLNPFSEASTTAFPGTWGSAPWINPFFGGVYLSNSDLLQPVITGSDQVLNLATGTVVSSLSNFVSGESGSSTHIGAASNQFQIGTAGYVGFAFETASGGAVHYGWLKMTFNNVGTGTINSWAYEDLAGAAIRTGTTTSADLLVQGSGNNVLLNSASPYNAVTTVQNSGKLTLGASNVLPSGNRTNLSINGSGVFDLASFSDTVASLSGDSTGTVKNSVASTTSTLTINSASGTATYAGVIAGSNGGTQGNVTVVKTGAGTQTLSGSSSYTGSTTINSGELVVNGSIAASSGVVVSGSATLSGHGAVSKISGSGLIAPGNSPGILTATQVDPSGGLDFNFQFTQQGAPTYSNASASGNDVLHITGTTPFTMALTTGNTITLDFSGATLAPGQIYYGGFFTNSAVANSFVNGATFSYVGLGGLSIQYDGFVNVLNSNFADGLIASGYVMEFEITSVVVPEPSTCVLLALGGAWLLLAHRRRHKRCQ